MNYYSKSFLVFFFIVATQLLSGCMIVQQPQGNKQEINENIQFELRQFNQSNFKQVEATFYTHKSKELVFRVLSDIEKTSQWLERVDSLEVLEVYNNQQYLLRTIINSPWPFKNRELITCVSTLFEDQVTSINISSCSDRVPVNDQYVRLLLVESSWTITKVEPSLVEINYKTWIDPAGNVPAFIFNSELINNTKVDLKKLQAIIENSSLSQYAY